MNELVAVIAALVGSSGIASILAGGTQFRRTHKLQAQIIELDAAKKLLSDQPRERAALEAATATIALELAAHVLIKADTRRLVLLGLGGTSFIGAAMVAFGYLPPYAVGDFFFFPLPAPKEGNVALVVSGIAILLSGYVALFLYVYLRLSRRRRDRLIRSLLAEPDAHAADSAVILRVARAMTDPMDDRHQSKPNDRKETPVGITAKTDAQANAS